MSFKNIPVKWKWAAGIIIILLVIFFGVRIKDNGGSISTPKHVSFVQQANGSGTHVWYMTTGQAKDSSVYYIIVLKNGKARTYRVYDDDTTLGKVSKMNDSQAIRYAKIQDKKYFDASSKEASLVVNDEHAGFNNDFEESYINMPKLSLLKKDDKVMGLAIPIQDESGMSYVTFNANGKMTSGIKGVKQLPEDVSMTESISFPDSTDKDNSNKAITKKIYNGVAEHAKNTNYQAPEAMKVKASSKTDDSGNNIISQTATIQYTSSVDGSGVTDNFLKLAQGNPAMIARIYQLDKADYEAENSEDPSTSKVDSAVATFNTGVDKMFTKKFCYDLTKGVFSNDQEEYTMNLKETTGFDIYDAHFIGYYRGTHNGYLVTKAQNDKQDAVFAK